MRIIQKNTFLQGFTFLEIIVTILMVGVLASMAIPRYLLSVERARTREGIQMLSTTLDVMRIFEFENGIYPSNTNQLSVTIPALTNFLGPAGTTRIDANCSPTVACAAVQRNGGGYDYTINVFEDGDITCTDGTTAGICARLGL